jgi:hypothetical protein
VETTMAALTVGGAIDAYCSKCKSVKSHVLVALKGGRPAKTECGTCGSVHAYRKTAPDTSKKRSPFEDAMDGRDTSKAIPYKLDRKFNLSDVVKHKSFGIGLVTRVISDKKMEVLFEQSTKLLIHGR